MKNCWNLVFISLLVTGCASGPNYKVPPITIEYAKVSNYWTPKRPITEKDIKTFSGPGMGCRAVYLSAPENYENSYIDVKFTIDSTGKQYDQQIVGRSRDVNFEAANWALGFGLSPIYEFKPSPANYDNLPIISTKRLYLVSGSPLCKSMQSGGSGYSNQSISISK